MYTGRIVALTLAVGPGGVAARAASGSDNRTLRTEPAARLRGGTVNADGCGISSWMGQP
ncbi:MAG: hypothetical protein QOF07_2411 [Bradyrhizobium sp.]|jgi:hypothetical protein|nr:hypothetical protein [Bradyrhizobium sp.]